MNNKQKSSLKYKPIAMSKSSTQDDPILQNTTTYKSFYRFLFNIVAICCGSFFFGYGLSYFSAYPIQQIRTQFKITTDADTLKGILNAIVPAGAFFGAILSSPLLKYKSRRNSLVIVCYIAILGGSLTLISSFVPLILGRLIIGIAVGFYSSICPLFINQMSPIELSGIFGTMNQLFIVLGVIVANLFTLAVSDNTKVGSPISAGWRFIFGGTILIAVVQALLLLFVYTNQTPKYLLLIDRKDQAKNLIEELYLPQYSDMIYDRLFREVYPDLSESAVSTDQIKSSNEESSLLAIIVGFHLAFLQQMSGINVVVLYCGDILNNVISSEWIKLCRILLQAVSLVGCFGATYFIKNLGRKTLLQIGSIGVGVCLAIIGTCFAVNTDGSNYTIVIMLYVYMLIFGFTLGPIVWMYIPQIIKSKWVPFTTMTNWAGCMITVFLFPIIRNAMDTPLYIFFFLGAWCLGSAAFNHQFLVESKNKTMTEIDCQYQNKCK